MFSKEITFQNIEGAINSDTIYLRLCNFNEDGASYDENSTEGWIKGVVDGNKFCVKNEEELFTHEPYRGDTTLVYAYGANFGKGNVYYEYYSNGGIKSSSFTMDVRLTHKDITSDYNHDTWLINNPQSGILIAPAPLTEINYGRWDTWGYGDTNCEAIEDFLIGIPMKGDLEKLPIPKVTIGETTPTEGNSMKFATVYLDLVTEDGYLLDTSKLFIAFYNKNAYNGTRAFNSAGTPLKRYMGSEIAAAKYFRDENPADFIVFCYYLKDDGSRLLSEWVNMNGVVQPPVSIDDLEVDLRDLSEPPVYDLNGRRMKDMGNLSPGIYIRAGKKFVVR